MQGSLGGVQLAARPAAPLLGARQAALSRRCSGAVVRADASFTPRPTPPKGVTQPPVTPEIPLPKFGFVYNAERLNSRAAMIGFFALIALEFVLGRGVLEMVGLRVGNGLPFEI